MHLHLDETWVINAEISSLLGLTFEEYGLLLVDDGRSARWTFFTNDVEYVRMIDAAQAAGGGPVEISCPLPGKAFQRAGWPGEFARVGRTLGRAGRRRLACRINKRPGSTGPSCPY